VPPRDPHPEFDVNPATTLRDASVQEIQLELIRRTRFNDFDGEQVCELLMKHRGLWRAVLFDQPGVPNYAERSLLLTGGLIKLRDLDRNIWNVDKLFVLTHTPAQARELAALFDELGGGMPTVHEDRNQTDMALGTGGEGHGLLTVWWD
jgi:hypothetical protein